MENNGLFFPDLPYKSRKDFIRELFCAPVYSGDEVCCLHPVIIVNPSLPELLYRYPTIVTSTGVRHFKNTSRGYFFFNWKPFSVNVNKITYENYKETYVVDESTGDTFPVYLLVPCGHCDCCKKTRLDSYAHRCVLESQAYDCFPWFVTLTYAPSDRPADGVSLRDCQTFLKRFRINLVRHGYSRRFRYFLVSEYSPVGRPHYHLILWNICPQKDFSYRKIMYLLTSSWSHGFCYNELVSPYHTKGYSGFHKNDPKKCFEYVSKYIGKGSNVPEGQNSTFYTASNRGGGIGAPFIDKFVSPTQRKYLLTDFLYCDKFSVGSVNKVFFNRYVLNRVFPTFSSSIPLKFRNAWRDLLLYNAQLDYSYRQDEFKRLYSLLSKHIPSPPLTFNDVSRDEPSCLSHCPFIRYLFDQALVVIDKYLPKCDFELAHELHRKRNLFVSKLLQKHKVRDLNDIAYKFRQYQNLRDATVFLPM